MPEMHDLLLRPRDPVIFRDARPFAAEPGAQAVTLKWPMPGTVAGAVRTFVGNSRPFEYDWRNDPDAQKRALAMEFQGAFLVARKDGDAAWTLFLPAPLDAVPYAKGEGGARTKTMMMLRPVKDLGEAGVNLPDDPPGLLPLKIDEDVKPDGKLDFWSFDDLAAWLASPNLASWKIRNKKDDRPEWVLSRLREESRTHVAIDPAKRTALDGALFTTVGLVFRDYPGRSKDEPETAIFCRITPPDGSVWKPESGFLSLGGERRLARVLTAPSPVPGIETPPESLRAALRTHNTVRLQLLTPGIFEGGWLPGWVQRNEPVPGTKELNLNLVSAAVGRRVPVSGWDMKERAEKATRWTAPAGSVYFFKTADGKPLSDGQIDALWFTSVSDGEQDRLDGYGIVVPGVWSEE